MEKLSLYLESSLHPVSDLLAEATQSDTGFPAAILIPQEKLAVVWAVSFPLNSCQYPVELLTARATGAYH